MNEDNQLMTTLLRSLITEIVKDELTKQTEERRWEGHMNEYLCEMVAQWDHAVVGFEEITSVEGWADGDRRAEAEQKLQSARELDAEFTLLCGADSDAYVKANERTYKIAKATQVLENGLMWVDGPEDMLDYWLNDEVAA